MQISVLLVENETVTRIGLKTILENGGDIKIVGEAETGSTGFEMFRTLKPDVTILSLRLPESCAVEEMDEYFAEDKNAKIIVLAEHAGDAEIRQALKKGALGYICKDVSTEELIKAVRVVNASHKYIPQDIANILSEHLGEEELTKTEKRVLKMIVSGMSNKEIAFSLEVSENTTKTHVKNIFDKLRVSDRTSATTMAIKRGLVRIWFEETQKFYRSAPIATTANFLRDEVAGGLLEEYWQKQSWQICGQPESCNKAWIVRFFDPKRQQPAGQSYFRWSFFESKILRPDFKLKLSRKFVCKNHPKVWEKTRLD